MSESTTDSAPCIALSSLIIIMMENMVYMMESKQILWQRCWQRIWQVDDSQLQVKYYANYGKDDGECGKDDGMYGKDCGKYGKDHGEYVKDYVNCGKDYGEYGNDDGKCGKDYSNDDFKWMMDYSLSIGFSSLSSMMAMMMIDESLMTVQLLMKITMTLKKMMMK